MAVDARIKLINQVTLTNEELGFYTQEGFLKEPIYFQNLVNNKLVVTRNYHQVIDDLTQFVTHTGSELWVEFEHDYGPMEVLHICGEGNIIRYQHN